jgi:geranylgeranyl diphosphate synthase type II
MDILKEMEYRAGDADRIIARYLPDEEGYQKTIMEAMNYSIMAGGKRLRPILMAETYKLFGGHSKALDPFMAAIEMIHTYSLVHDDLPAMDNDMLRRGNPTTHAKFGEAMGVLAGDALLNYAFETAFKAFDLEPDDTEKVVKSLKILSDKAGIYGMIGGQVVDIEEDKQNGISRNRINFLYEKKTACLIEAAMMIGAVLAGADNDEVNEVEKIGHNIGIAFQIEDDILDVEGDQDTIGKEIGQDIKNNKVTYVAFEGYEKSKADIWKLTGEAVGILQGMPYQNKFLTALLYYLTDRNS